MGGGVAGEIREQSSLSMLRRVFYFETRGNSWDWTQSFWFKNIDFWVEFLEGVTKLIPVNRRAGVEERG